MSQAGSNNVSSSPSVATTFNEDVGTATPVANIINVVGGVGISTTGAGNTITIDADGSVPTTFTEDVGSATPAANTLQIVGGAGISTSGAGNTVTITATAAGFSWNVVAGAAQALVKENGYINTNVALTTYTLPAVAAIGDTFQILGKSAGGWAIAQNAGQQVHVSGTSTTVGVTGSVASANLRDCIELVCSVANTDFTAVDFVGTLTVT